MEHKYSQAMNNTTDAYNKITSRIKGFRYKAAAGARKPA